jgi:uncharacterized protein (DUF2236 family)
MPERIMLLSAGRMLMMQMAHPAVSAGVQQHSAYRSDPWKRVRYTTDFYLQLVHARSSDVLPLRKKLQATHSHIAGQTEQGVKYHALDPELQLWVQSTLSDSVLWYWQQSFGPLSAADLGRYWAEQRILALACGIPAEVIPASLEEWQAYIDTQCEELSINQGTIQLWSMLEEMPKQGPNRVNAKLWRLIRRPTGRIAKYFTIAGLPAQLREQLQISWTVRQRRAARRRLRGLGYLVKLLPPEIRYSTRARHAQAAAKPLAVKSNW